MSTVFKNDKAMIKPISEIMKNMNLVGLMGNIKPEGTLVYVPKNEISNSVINFDFSEKQQSDILIIVDSNAKLDLVINMFGKCDSGKISTKIVLNENSKINFSEIQNLDPSSKLVKKSVAELSKDSTLDWTTINLGANSVESKRQTYLKQSGAELNDIEIFFVDGKQNYNLPNNIYHVAPNTKSRIKLSGILRDSAKVAANGLVQIERGAKQSNSFLAEHGLLLSSDARCDLTPSLEIEESDVQAGHSSSVAQIDPERIFYLMSRGLSKEQAKETIALGFLRPAISSIPFGDVRENIENLVINKWENKAEVVI